MTSERKLWLILSPTNDSVDRFVCAGNARHIDVVNTWRESHANSPHHTCQPRPGMLGLAPKWSRLAPNGTNPGSFHFRFHYVLISSSASQNVLKFDMKKPRICPIWGHSDPLCSQTWHPWLGFCAEATMRSSQWSVRRCCQSHHPQLESQVGS